MKFVDFERYEVIGDLSITPITPKVEANLLIETPSAQIECLRRKREQNDDDRAYYVMRKGAEIKIWLKDGGTWTIRIRAGWITDLGSVPTWARSFVDNDDPRFLNAFIVHDVLCAIHALSFESTNNALDQIARLDGAPSFKRFIVRRAVDWGGRSAWDESAKHIAYEERWASFTWGHQ